MIGVLWTKGHVIAQPVFTVNHSLEFKQMEWSIWHFLSIFIEIAI
jgi:hypothetical protein